MKAGVDPHSHCHLHMDDKDDILLRHPLAEVYGINKISPCAHSKLMPLLLDKLTVSDSKLSAVYA